jgi:hypothetical protein
MKKRKFSRFLSRAQLFIGILLILYAFLLASLEGAIGNKFPSSFNPVPPALGLLACIVLLTILQGLLSAIHRKQMQDSTQSNPTSNQEDYLRQRLIERVYSAEVERFLNASPYHQHPLHVPLSIHHQKREEGVLSHPLPQAILFDIAQVYERAKDGLLLLGGAGSGKTTQLLLLAKHLLEKAHASQHNSPIPIIFRLAEWTDTTPELMDWLVEQLAMHGIPPGLRRPWLEFGTIQPFLDGLDEVDQHQQQKCIEQINRYRQHHGLVPLVVTCRTDHYAHQHVALLLESTVEVLPLSLPTVDVYLSEVNEPTSGKVRIALQRDAVLRDLLSTPPILQIFVKAYQTIPLEDVLRPASFEERRHIIFQAYIQEMLRHRKPCLYPPNKTLCWLSWLAAQMGRKKGIARESEDTLFRPQRLDLEWFPDRGLTPQWVLSILLICLFWLFALCFRNVAAVAFASIYTLFFSRGPLAISDSLHERGISDTPWYEVRRSVVAASISGGLAGCVSAFFWGQGLGLTVGTYIGLGTGLVLGGLYYLTYAVLSACLWWKGYKPWSYSRFLAYAVDCGLLRRRKGRYQFPHLLLRDHFAALNKLRTSDFGQFERERFKDSSTLGA